MQNLVVSMLRFSAALTLFGAEQFDKTLNAIEGKDNLSKTMEGIEKTLDTMTDVLTREMDDRKKETLRSMAKLSSETVQRTMEGMEVMDPREVLRVTTDLLEKSTDVASRWASRAATAVEKAVEKEKAEEAPAAEATPAQEAE
ncbi:MAG: hypothetical protein A3F68_10540 [Acidobacteria bacterium RIFCSPLOWO2_12_FULL_54_10]|nr:MAG: hypothetical protein A3F68_10540 [Acidobacteria bacterium RIFCSPLOWO2_12_FULL_54_10]